MLIGKFFTFYPFFPSHAPPRKHERAQAIHSPYISMYETHRESDGSSNRRCKKEAIWVVEESYIGRRADLYWSVTRPILLHAVTNIGSTSDQYETVAGECCPLFRALRHLAPSPPDMPLQSDTQALRLIVSIPLIQRWEKSPSHEEKSAFP